MKLSTFTKISFVGFLCMFLVLLTISNVPAGETKFKKGIIHKYGILDLYLVFANKYLFNIMIIITYNVRFYFWVIRQNIIETGKCIGAESAVAILRNEAVAIFTIGNIFVETKMMACI